MDILERLRNGESVDDIAAEMTKSLNEAKAAFDKENEEAKVKEAAEKAKYNDASVIVDEILDFLYTYYNVTVEDCGVDEFTRQLIDMCDAMVGFNSIFDVFKPIGRDKKAAGRSFVDTVLDFLG